MTVLAIDDSVEIGVFAGDEPVYLQKHRLGSGKQTITMTVPSLPTRAGIDPRSCWLIGRQRTTSGP